MHTEKEHVRHGVDAWDSLFHFLLQSILARSCEEIYPGDGLQLFALWP